MKNLLFISHDASRTGAPIILLHLLKWMKENTDISYTILLRNDGELKGEFEKLGKTYVYYDQYKGKKLVAKVFSVVFQRIKSLKLKWLLKKQDFDLIYSNTIVNADVLESISDIKCPVVSHVHELEYAIMCFGGEKNIQKLKNTTTHFVAASESVRDNLIKNHNIPSAEVSLVYEFIESHDRDLTWIRAKSLEARKELGIPEDGIIIGASGTIDLRKGTELFIQVARDVLKKKHTENIYFLWIGGDLKNAQLRLLQMDIEKIGIQSKVIFWGSTDEPEKYYSAFDIFLLTSREDPYPLVMLESAVLAKPVVCFEKSGGGQEFVSGNAGVAIPYMDVEEMAKKIIELSKDSSARISLGQKARIKVLENHTVDNTAPLIMSVIEKVLISEKKHMNRKD